MKNKFSATPLSERFHWMHAVFCGGIVAGLATMPCLVFADNQSPHQSKKMSAPKIEKESFGQLADGTQVSRYRITNAHGNSIGLMEYGATLLEVVVPDAAGNLANVNLKFDALKPYLGKHPYFGSTVGRFCNRIAEGKFSIDGANYQVTLNHGKHHLHGGEKNFSHQLWQSEELQGDDFAGVRFTLVSEDGEEGFPGQLTVHADYLWNNANELTVVFTASTTSATHVNLTNHSYWNLGGADSGTALNHIAQIDADFALNVDDDLIPDGKLNPVEGTPLDFLQPTPLSKNVEALPATKGFDHCFVVRGEAGTLRKAATVVDPESKRTLEIETTQPGVQLYSANHLPGNDHSAGAGSHDAFCLETQHYPNAPNLTEGPSTLLRPGETMKETTVHRFGVQSN